MKKKIVSLLLTMALATSLFVGCGSTATESSSTAESQEVAEETAVEEAEEVVEEEVSVEITDVSFYGLVVEYTSGPMMCDATEELLADQYNIDMIQVDWSNLEQVIRTGIASGDPCDVYNFPGNRMSTFEEYAVDLTPYLDANDGEWRSQFSEAALEMCTVNGKVVAIPWEVNAPVLLANVEIFEEAGVDIPESWTYDEFYEACAKIADCGYFPFATPMDLSQGGWLWRNAMLSSAVATDTYEEYCAGTLDFTGTETETALEAIKAIYDNGYAYPGEGAVTVSKDESQAAFSQGEIAIISNVAAGASALAAELSFETVAIPWPTLGTETTTGGSSTNAFFIPSNSDNIEGAIEVIKAFTSTEVAAIHSSEGYISANANIESTDPLAESLAALFASPYTSEFSNTAMIEYYNNSLMPDLLLYGGVDVVQQNIEAIRLESLSE